MQNNKYVRFRIKIPSLMWFVWRNIIVSLLYFHSLWSALLFRGRAGTPCVGWLTTLLTKYRSHYFVLLAQHSLQCVSERYRDTLTTVMDVVLVYPQCNAWWHCCECYRLPQIIKTNAGIILCWMYLFLAHSCTSFFGLLHWHRLTEMNDCTAISDQRVVWKN